MDYDTSIIDDVCDKLYCNIDSEKEDLLYEKYKKLANIYGLYVMCYCTKCKEHFLATSLLDELNCEYCKAPLNNIEIEEDNEFYKKMCKDGIILESEYAICENCGENKSFVDFILNDLRCPKCNHNLTDDVKNIEVKDDEDKEYYCKNCLEHFTKEQLNQNNGKCPHCEMEQKELEIADPEDKELDYQIPNEDWENI